MKRTLLGLAALIGLILTLIPSVFVFTGTISAQTNKMLMGIGMLVWFVLAPFWMKRAR